METVKCKGYAGYFGLDDWWLNELTESDRHLVRENYSSNFDSTKIDYTSGTAIFHLHGAAFNNLQHFETAIKLIHKAEELLDSEASAEDGHFLFDAKVRLHQKNRSEPQLLIEACKQQISYSVEYGKIVRREDGRDVIVHSGYNVIVRELEYQKKYDEAIKYAKQAKRQGWRNDWDKIILELEDKKGLK